MKNEIPETLVEEVAIQFARLWLERMPQLATVDEIEKQERIMAKEIIELVRVAGMETSNETQRR